jgi:outer membrane protein insertion porin family
VIEEARQRVQGLYRREGFASAAVTTRQDIRSATGTVDVTFEIDEGPRQIVGDVVVEGNRGIDRDVITRALRFETGEPLRAQDWVDARRRLFDTGLFRRVDMRSEPLDSTETAARMRVRVVVEEWPALRLRYGFQAAEERPEGSLTGRNVVPGLNADLTRRTLFGRAVTTVGVLELQRRNRLAQGTVTAPTFLSLPVSSSLVLARSREEFAAATLVTDRAGVSWEQRSRLARDHLDLSYTYRFERNHTFDTEPSTNPLFPAFDITINIARLIAAGAWDSRNDAGDTTRGSLLSYTFEYAPASLGSDIRFVRHLTQVYHFRNWHGVVFGSAARVGFVSPLAGQELIPSERFFAGGARTVRGVPEDGLGPRDFFGDPAGGEAMLVLNQEARFPIYRWFRGVGFIDAGNVFQRPSDFNLNNLVGAVGGGLRVVTPIALLRVDYGLKIWPGPRTDSGQWFFGIGQTF